MPIVGQKLNIGLKLWDGDATKYPVAYVLSDDGTLLGSYDLIHDVNGFYAPAVNIVFPPSVEFVTAYYIVYDDAGHTTRSQLYSDSVETIYQTKTPADAIYRLDLILSLLNIIEGESSGYNLEGKVMVDTNILRSVITEVTTLRGLILESDTQGKIRDDNSSIIGIIEDSGITGETEGT